MIVTITPNPAVDRTVFIDALRPGEITHGARSWSEPSGKAVNVALALAAHHRPTLAVLPAGGPEGHLMEELLDAAGVARRSVAVAGALRMNVSVLEPDGTTTKLNEPGPRLSQAEVDALLTATLDVPPPRCMPRWSPGCASAASGSPSTPPAAR